jgi:ankyrin repeat protein
VAFAIRSSAVRQVQGTLGSRLERVEEKLADFEARFKDAEEKVAALEEGLTEVRDEYWAGVEKERVNKTFLFKLALERARQDLADGCVAAPELLEGDKVECDELQCRKCSRAVAPFAAKYWPNWRSEWQYHRGDRDKSCNDVPVGCKTMARCRWSACMACAQEAVLAQRYYALFSAFCMFLQSQVRLALTGLAACASGYVAANTSITANSVLTHALGSIPYVGHIVKSGVVSLAGWLQMVTNRTLMTRLTSNAQEDKTIEDYCVRITQYCQYDLLRDSAGPTLSGAVRGAANKLVRQVATDALHFKLRLRERVAETVKNLAVTSLQQCLTSVHADPFIKQHWHGLAANYVLRFVSFLRDQHTSFSSVSSLGLLAAEHVIPKWFSEKELKVADAPPAGFSCEEAAACAMVCAMCSDACPAQLEWKARCDWGFAGVRVVAAGHSECYVLMAPKCIMLCFTRDAMFALSPSRGLGLSTVNRGSGAGGSIAVHGSVLEDVTALLTSTAEPSGDTVMAQLASCLQADSSRRVIVTGHGRGGALAAVATLLVLKEVQQAIPSNLGQITALVFGCASWCVSDDRVRAAEALKGRLYSVISHDDHLANYACLSTAQYATIKCEYELTPTSIKRLQGETPARQLSYAAGTVAKTIVLQLPKLLVMSVSSWLGHTLSSPLVDTHALSSYVAHLVAVRSMASAVAVEDRSGDDQAVSGSPATAVGHNSVFDGRDIWKSVLALDRIVDRKLTDPAEIALLQLLLSDGHESGLPALEIAVDDSGNIDVQTLNRVRYPDEVTKAAFDAVEEGEYERLTKLLAQHPELLRSTDSEGNTLFIAAARSNRVRSLEILLTNSDPPNAAAQVCVLDEAKTAFPCGVNTVNSEQYTALMYCCQRGYTRAAELLLAHPMTDPAICNSKALQLAGEDNHPDIVRSLVGVPAVNVNVRTSGGGFNLLAHAIRRGYTDVATALLQRDDVDLSADATDGDATVLQMAIICDADADVVASILKCGTDVNWADSYGNTALHLACFLNRCSVVELLMKCSTLNVNMSDGAGMTPLEWAMSAGNDGVIQLLLEQKSIEVRPEYFRSLAYKDFADVVLLLYTSGLVTRMLDKGLDPNTACSNGTSVLHIAVLQDSLGLLQLLLSHPGINVNCQDKKGATPLLRGASAACNMDIMRVLLALPDIDVNLPSRRGGTALAASIWHGCKDLTVGCCAATTSTWTLYTVAWGPFCLWPVGRAHRRRLCTISCGKQRPTLTGPTRSVGRNLWEKCCKIWKDLKGKYRCIMK